MIKVLVVFLMMVTSLMASETVHLTFEALTEEAESWLAKSTPDETSLHRSLTGFENETVAIRGFLYEEEGLWYLASQASLRSCCLGGKHKAALLIQLDRTFDTSESGKSVAATGQLRVEVQRSPSGEVLRLYRLEQTSLMNTKPLRFPFVSVAALVLLAASLIVVIALRAGAGRDKV